MKMHDIKVVTEYEYRQPWRVWAACTGV